ncbi:MAG: Homeodomain-like protein, partial [Linnemannia elongata]
MTESSTLEHQSPHGELRTAFYNPYDIKRRRRTSRSQFKTLEKAFIENPKPNASTRQQLAQRLSMTPRGIQVWFQNRRAKNKQANT